MVPHRRLPRVHAPAQPPERAHPRHVPGPHRRIRNRRGVPLATGHKVSVIDHGVVVGLVEERHAQTSGRGVPRRVHVRVGDPVLRGDPPAVGPALHLVPEVNQKRPGFPFVPPGQHRDVHPRPRRVVQHLQPALSALGRGRAPQHGERSAIRVRFFSKRDSIRVAPPRRVQRRIVGHLQVGAVFVDLVLEEVGRRAHGQRQDAVKPRAEGLHLAIVRLHRGSKRRD